MSETALIFDIKRYAIHDGPGIRTTFFLMGCPLRCLWCQNPESFKNEQRIAFNPMKCIGCDACRAVCDKLDETRRLPRAACTLCGDCVAVCHTGARVFTGKEMTPEEVLKIALEEKVFYDSSNGGVTFSGGECLMHADFMFQILKLCQESGIHTVVDTCGAVPWQTFERVRPYTNLFLYDLKVMNPDKHREYTGSDNHRILNNLENLCAAGSDVIIRIPLIPGLTDTVDNIEAIGRFIADRLKNRIIRAELLPYNKLAASKYGERTIWTDGGPGPYPLADLEPQDKETVQLIAERLQAKNIQVYAESL